MRRRGVFDGAREKFFEIRIDRESQCLTILCGDNRAFGADPAECICFGEYLAILPRQQDIIFGFKAGDACLARIVLNAF